MRNLKKISMVVIAILAILLMMGGVVNAATLTLKATADKKELAVGEEITVTVDWAKGMQAADFILNYDKDKVEFVSSPLTGTAYEKNNEQEGKVKIAWFSDKNEDMTKIAFKFKAKAEGEAKFSTEIDGGFADGQVVSPDSYDVKTYGATAVTLKAANINVPTTTPTTKPQETQKPTNTATPVPTATPAPQKPTTLPKAGDGLNVLAVIPVLLAVTVVAYVQIRKYKEI